MNFTAIATSGSAMTATPVAVLALLTGRAMIVMPHPSYSGAQLLEQRPGGLVEEPLLRLVADLHQRDVGEARLPVAAGRPRRSRRGRGRTGWTRRRPRGARTGVAPANPAGVGRSALTAQPPPNQRNCSWARSTAASLVGVPADRDLADRPRARRRSAGAPSASFQAVDQVGLGLDRDQVVGERREPLDRLLARDGDADRRRPRRAGPRSGPSRRGSTRRCRSTSSPVCSARMISIASSSMSWRVVDRRPALADDVLVEVLAAAEAEGEPAVGEQLQRRRLLRDDGRVVAHRRAGHVGHQLDPLGGLRDRAEHRPGVRRVPLLGRATGE